MLKKLVNPPTISMLLGIFAGLTGLGSYLPDFLTQTLESLKSCMGPTAMLLAGFTVANYSILKMLKNKKIYAATAMRLVIMPTIIITLLYFIKEGMNSAFSLGIRSDFLFLAFFAVSTPLGLNTVVFPESYGADPEPGAGMTLISHTLCILTIPFMYMLLTSALGTLNL